ncbi:MAG: prephenate dehydrogenase/arogenate dehydrogenase family protein [Syntrophaceae bacterium]|nr:prephenate dehydrogenase/arogenate dehydrogenase family protein [Syntrophaceae bacterium]
MKNTGTPISPPKRFPIGIIGGTGGMGRWFAAFFEKEGHPVIVSGKGTGPRPDEMAASCPVVIVSVPIGATIEVIRQVGPHMKRESLLMDLTSLKAQPVRAMLESSVSEVIGLHPLFGPSVPSLEGQNIAICPARGGRWLPWARDVFGRNGAKLVETTPERHDEIMAVVQVLNHLSTLALGLAVHDTGISREELVRFSTPLFRGKMEMIDRVFSRPDLHAEIIGGNPHTGRMIGLYRKALDRIAQAALEGDAPAVAALMRTR